MASRSPRVPSPRSRGEGQGEGPSVKFGEVPVGEAEGAILAHSLRLAGIALKKGRVLSAADLEAIAAAGLDHVIVARLDPGDIREDAAAECIAAAGARPNITVASAFSRRANLFAETRGPL